MRRAWGWSVDLMVSGIIGCTVATLLAVVLVQACIGSHLESIDLWFAERNVPWWLSRHQAVGAWWINGHQNLSPLLGETPLQAPNSREPSAAGAPPEAWAATALPQLAGLPIDSRFAALGAGWPLPAFVRTWVIMEPHAAFPIQAEIDESEFAFESAIARVGQEGLAGVRLRPIAFAVDTLPWSLLCLLGLRSLRRFRLNRPAASAAPPAPAA